MTININSLGEAISGLPDPKFTDEVYQVHVRSRTDMITSVFSDGDKENQVTFVDTLTLRAKKYGYGPRTWLEWELDIELR